MAGGKAKPRVKDDWYDVLGTDRTLALNVSNAVLEKFAALNSTWWDLEEATGVNSRTVQTILDATSSQQSVTEAKDKKQNGVREATEQVITKQMSEEALSQDHSGREMPEEENSEHKNIAEEKMLSSNKPHNSVRTFEKPTWLNILTRLRALPNCKLAEIKP